MKYQIQEDMEIYYQDEGPFRSYELYVSGDNLQEMIANACVSEIDQDGGEIDTYALDDASNEIIKKAFLMIEMEIQAYGYKNYRPFKIVEDKNRGEVNE